MKFDLEMLWKLMAWNLILKLESKCPPMWFNEIHFIQGSYAFVGSHHREETTHWCKILGIKFLAQT